MKETEDLQPIVQGKRCLQYFIAFDMQTIQEESYKENNNLHDDDTELHEQPWRMQHGIFLPFDIYLSLYIYSEAIITLISFFKYISKYIYIIFNIFK